VLTSDIFQENLDDFSAEYSEMFHQDLSQWKGDLKPTRTVQLWMTTFGLW